MSLLSGTQIESFPVPVMMVLPPVGVRYGTGVRKVLMRMLSDVRLVILSASRMDVSLGADDNET